MVGFTQERQQPILLQAAESLGNESLSDARLSRRPEPPFTGRAILFAAAIGLLWIGTAIAYLWGYFGMDGLLRLPLQLQALAVFATFLPPALFIAVAWVVGRSLALGQSAETFLEATDRIFAADETAAKTAGRLGRTVRRELDGLNAGLDGAFARLRALEGVLESQIAALDEAGARADVRGQAVAARLTQERERIESISEALADTATRATETVAGRAAQMKSMIEAAEANLRAAGQTLNSQADTFKAAVGAAAEAPHAAAVELDRQAKRIETVSDAALARAEFVLGRQERHRTAMGELLSRFREESTGFETALEQQRRSLEQAIANLGSEAGKFQNATGEAGQNIELMMVAAAARVSQLTAAYAREADRLKDTSESASLALTQLVDALRNSGTGAQALISETTSQAKSDAKALVGDAMAECEKLLRAATKLSNEADAVRTTLTRATEEVEKHVLGLPAIAQAEAARVRQMVQSETESVRNTLSKAAEDVERHVLNLPGIAQQEAQRVRNMVRSETEVMLDLSARTLSTVHARIAQRGPQKPKDVPPTEQESDPESLIGMARRLTQRPKKKTEERKPSDEKWEMSTLLAAAEGGDGKSLKPGAAAAMGALEVALADLAVDLNAIAGDILPGDEEWRRYLSGDRTIFARRLASAIDEGAVDRITALYRDNLQFRSAADLYLKEFEALLSRAREGDGGGLLAPTMLSADTGKIYLAVAYALGRLE